MKPKFRRFVAAALERRVKRLLRTHKLRVVAITGSVGKTSTKLAVAKVLGQKFKVLVHPGNYNSELGLPLSKLGLGGMKLRRIRTFINREQDLSLLQLRAIGE